MRFHFRSASLTTSNSSARGLDSHGMLEQMNLPRLCARLGATTTRRFPAVLAHGGRRQDGRTILLFRRLHARACPRHSSHICSRAARLWELTSSVPRQTHRMASSMAAPARIWWTRISETHKFQTLPRVSNTLSRIAGRLRQRLLGLTPNTYVRAVTVQKKRGTETSHSAEVLGSRPRPISLDDPSCADSWIPL